MKWIRRLWPFVLMGLVVWVCNYPIYTISGKIKTASRGKVQVLSSSGSVWAGQMWLGVSDGQQVYAIPGAVQWRVRRGQGIDWVGMTIEHPTFLSPVQIGLSTHGLTVAQGGLQMPASWLSVAGAPFNTIRPEGLMQFSWTQWRVGNEVQASLRWIDAQSALSGIRPLGEYILTVTGGLTTTMNLVLATQKGPLILEGSGQWTKGQGVVFNGYASAQEHSRQALTGLLSQMGQLEGNRYRLHVF